MKTTLPILLGLGAGWPLMAWSHEGHGLGAGGHWHATDTLGFLAVVALLAALWLWRGRK